MKNHYLLLIFFLTTLLAACTKDKLDLLRHKRGPWQMISNMQRIHKETKVVESDRTDTFRLNFISETTGTVSYGGSENAFTCQIKESGYLEPGIAIVLIEGLPVGIFTSLYYIMWTTQERVMNFGLLLAARFFQIIKNTINAG